MQNGALFFKLENKNLSENSKSDSHSPIERIFLEKNEKIDQTRDNNSHLTYWDKPEFFAFFKFQKTS